MYYIPNVLCIDTPIVKNENDVYVFKMQNITVHL